MNTNQGKLEMNKEHNGTKLGSGRVSEERLTTAAELLGLPTETVERMIEHNQRGAYSVASKGGDLASDPKYRVILSIAKRLKRAVKVNLFGLRRKRPVATGNSGLGMEENGRAG